MEMIVKDNNALLKDFLRKDYEQEIDRITKEAFKYREKVIQRYEESALEEARKKKEKCFKELQEEKKAKVNLEEAKVAEAIRKKKEALFSRVISRLKEKLGDLEISEKKKVLEVLKSDVEEKALKAVKSDYNTESGGMDDFRITYSLEDLKATAESNKVVIEESANGWLEDKKDYLYKKLEELTGIR